MRKSSVAGDLSFRLAIRPAVRLPVSDSWVQWRLKDEPWVAKARTRLQSLSWFMRCLKEPLVRMANLQEKTRGGTDQRLGVSLDQQDGSAVGGWTEYGVIARTPPPLGTL